MAEALAADALFCDIPGDINTTLDHNVSAEAARSHKYAGLVALDRISVAVSGERTGLTAASGRQLVISTVLLAASLWPVAHPPGDPGRDLPH